MRRYVALAGDQMLIMERADDVWLVALYRKRKLNEAGGEITPERWERVRKTWMQAGEERERWVRIAVKRPSLATALAHILASTRPRVDLADVRAYIESTTWGAGLL